MKYVSILCALTLIVVACSDEEGGAGSTCDASAGDSACTGELVCADNGSGKNTCQRDYGSNCNPEDEKTYCRFGSECQVTQDGANKCLITEGSSCAEAEDACASDLTCADLSTGEKTCLKPVLIRGQVRDSLSGEAVEGAHVIALNELKAAVSDVAISDAEGNYVLEVPVVRADAEGNPVNTPFTLRASAQDYLTFPGGLRQALPINTSEATSTEDGFVVQGTLTDVLLIPLPDAEKGRPSISGKVISDSELAAGVLVVAESSPTSGITAVSDLDGDFTIFNVADGSYTVKGYRAGLQLNPVDVSVSAEDVTGVELTESSDGLATVDGNLQIVNALGGLTTSVILVVESTFDPNFVRGETPAGLRAPESGPPTIEGAWSIQGVPAGRYVVLAAFENDNLVRDPDTCIGGTEIVTIEVGNANMTVDQSFKITEHLAVISPGVDTPEGVSGSVDLTWADDSSEDNYIVEVYNAYGDKVWENRSIPGVSGSKEVTETYGGPLESGMYYQFRVWSEKSGCFLSTTEDLRGVFFGQ